MQQTLTGETTGAERAATCSILLTPRESKYDPTGKAVARLAQDFGLAAQVECRASRLYFLQGALSPQRLDELTRRLLLDPVIESLDTQHLAGFEHTVDVARLPGVTDTEGDNLIKAAHQLGFHEVLQASRGHRYHFKFNTPVAREQLAAFAALSLANEVIEVFSVNAPIPAPFIVNVQKQPVPEMLELEGLTSEQLYQLSLDLKLALDAREMTVIQEYYSKLDRQPTRCELETFAQTWSEHCVHKTFRARIDYTENGENTTIDGLLPILRQTTEELDLDWVVSAFVDNAGIVRFDSNWDIAIKAETHNHPSALEPFGGANTGVGGVVRDILGVSARPFANWDVLCFGPLESEPPEGTLPARQVMTGVVKGIADYGNKMGIPTVAGGVFFDEGYLANPLVYAGCLGILPHGPRATEVKDGDLVVLLGGKTGRDGLGGATFSSLEMDSTTAQECGTAVQIGHPIAEKVVSELLLRAHHEGLYNAVTDCGAGGLASAIGEMAESVGALVQLDRVPTKYPGLSPRELWLSEAQERMVCAVPAHKWARFQEIAKDYDTVCVDLGTFGQQGRLKLYYGDTQFADLEVGFLHKGLPRRQLKAEWNTPDIPEVPVKVDPQTALLNLLADPNICSRESVLRHYDFEVQGGTAVKPLNAAGGPNDGVAVVPYEVQDQPSPPAVSLGCGLNPWLTELDPRLGTLAAVDEAIRNVVAVGADPARISLLDNFSWGNPNLPDRLGKLTRSVLACAEGSRLHKAPFVSGKDSLNNEFKLEDGSRRAIPGTILISAVGFLPEVSLRVPASFQQPGDIVYLLGPEQPALGGSAYLRVHGGSSPHLPQAYEHAPQMYAAYHQAVRDRLVASCHDLSEGGLAVALAECCLSSGLGATIDTAPDTLFAEGPSRLLISVSPQKERALRAALEGFPLRRLGQVQATSALAVKDLFEVSCEELARAHEGTCFEALRHQHNAPSAPVKSFVNVPAVIGTQPKVAVLCAPGINRENDMSLALTLAGAKPELLTPHSGESIRLQDYQMLVLPGGFSFGDDLGAGRLWALSLERFSDQLQAFSQSGKAILGVCNGFQALLKTGLILQPDEQATLAHNESDHFECRWVDLEVQGSSHCLFTAGLQGHIRCPIAHGEGRLVASDAQCEQLVKDGRAPLLYSGSQYPANPNGSLRQIAALCNPAGNVMGLMPHPENNIFGWQAEPGDAAAGTGLALFRNALRNLS